MLTDMDMLLDIDMLLNGASFLFAAPGAAADALGAVAAAVALLLAALAWRYSGNASTSPATPSSFDSSVCQEGTSVIDSSATDQRSSQKRTTGRQRG